MNQDQRSRIHGARNLALIGYRATGKTHVGAALSGRIGWPVIDTDQVIQERSGSTIREIFAAGGEVAFRDWESEVIQDLLQEREHTIFSLGGGAILRPGNRATIRKFATTIWLRATPDEIWRRLEGDAATREQRPALTNLNGYNEIVAVLSEREPIYREASDFPVDTDNKSVDAIATEILSLVQLDYGPAGP